MTNDKGGVAALGLQRAIGLNNKTAWHLAHKIRTAIAQDRARLTDDVEMDEIFVGGHETKGQGAQRVHSNKSTVLVAVEHREIEGRSGAPGANVMSGRIRMKRTRDSSVHSIEEFIAENIEPGALIRTDAGTPYPPAIKRLKERGLRYRHLPTSLRGSGTRKTHLHLPAVNRATALLKRWLLGTHQGAVRDHQLDAYLDEFVFRFNRRTSRSRGLLFWRLICALVETPATTRDAIIGRKAALEEADAVTAKKAEKVSKEVKREVNRRAVTAHRERAKAAKKRPPPRPKPPPDPFS